MSLRVQISCFRDCFEAKDVTHHLIPEARCCRKPVKFWLEASTWAYCHQSWECEFYHQLQVRCRESQPSTPALATVLILSDAPLSVSSKSSIAWTSVGQCVWLLLNSNLSQESWAHPHLSPACSRSMMQAWILLRTLIWLLSLGYFRSNLIRFQASPLAYRKLTHSYKRKFDLILY